MAMPTDHDEVVHRVTGYFSILRQGVVFVLGIGVILDALLTQGTHVSELVVGLVMVGIIPLDVLLTRIGLRRDDTAAGTKRDTNNT
jgi:hypothetical protein